MTLSNLKELAEQFRAVAGNQPAVEQLATLTIQAYPLDQEVVKLCFKLVEAKERPTLESICDVVKRRTV